MTNHRFIGQRSRCLCWLTQAHSGRTAPLGENFREERYEPIGLFTRERVRRSRIEIEHRDELALHDDRDDELALRSGVTRDVSWESIDVRHELHFSRARAGPTNSACEVDAQASHRPLIRANGQELRTRPPIETAPARLHERRVEEAGESGLDGDPIGLPGDGRTNLRKSCIQTRHSREERKEESAVDDGQVDAFGHGGEASSLSARRHVAR